MQTAYLSLGSNLGTPQKNLRTALEEIAAFAEITEISSIYETEPEGYKDQPNFFNMAIEISTDLNPTELIVRTQEVEHKMGRIRDENNQNAARIIDIDIIFFDDKVINTAHLKIPHPRADKRQFVMTPLAEIAPNYIHPLLQKSVTKIKNDLKSKSKITIWTSQK